MVMATLGIASNDFFDSSPVEIYYAFKAVGEHREDEFKQLLIVARAQAFMLINGQVGMKTEWLLKSEKELGLFYWEEKEKAIPAPKQSQEDMKTVLMNIVNTHNAQVAKQEKMKRITPPVAGVKHTKKKK